MAWNRDRAAVLMAVIVGSVGNSFGRWCPQSDDELGGKVARGALRERVPVMASCSIIDEPCDRGIGRRLLPTRGDPAAPSPAGVLGKPMTCSKCPDVVSFVCVCV